MMDGWMVIEVQISRSSVTFEFGSNISQLLVDSLFFGLPRSTCNKFVRKIA